MVKSGLAQCGGKTLLNKLEFAGLGALLISSSAFASLSAGFDTMDYFYGSNSAGQSVFPAFEAKGDGTVSGSVFAASAQGELTQVLLPGSDYTLPFFEFPEAWVGTSSKLGSVQVQVGRKLEHWNHLDELWGLGIWQPRFLWDELHPDQVALTGAFLSVDRPNFHFVAMGSPINIPERGMPVDIRSGQLSSPSPWFLSPPQQIMLFGQMTPVNYNLNVPSLQQIIFHPGLSTMARIGADEGKEGLWGSVAYAYLPMNQLFLSYNGMLGIHSNAAMDAAEVSLLPSVLYHHLVSAEAGSQWGNFNAWVSVLDEQPVPDDSMVPSGWSSQQVAPSLAVSPAVEWSPWGIRPDLPSIQIAYLEQWGGNAPDIGPQAPSSGSFFAPRYPFQDAGQISIKYPYKDLMTWTKLLYDFGHDGAIFSSEIDWHVWKSWMVEAGVDLLATGSVGTPSPNDFIASYLMDDRVHGGLTYVF